MIQFRLPIRDTRFLILPFVALIITAASLTPAQAQNANASKKPALTPMDYIELQQLVARYAYALDTGADNGNAYADLYAADGVFIGMNQGQKGRSYRGRDQLAALARGGSRGPLYVSHFATGVSFEPAPEGAAGKVYVVIVDLGDDGKPGTITHGGHYEDVYVKTAAGWRFKSRIFYESEKGATPKQLQSSPFDAPGTQTR